MRIQKLLLSLLVLSNYVEAQSDTSGTFLAINSTAHLVVRGTFKGRDTTFMGSGFIINGEYVATCYHVYGDDDFHSNEIKVFYNYNYKNNPATYDSAFATLDYKTNGTQYDFKKHNYKESDRLSDFIVLKLSKRVTLIPVIFDSAHTNIGDNLITARLSYYEKIGSFKIHVAAQTLEFLIGSTQMVTLGFATHGFSGSPLFNKSGKIVGVVTAGLSPNDSKELLLEMQRNGNLSKEKTARLVEGLKNNPEYSICISTNIKFIIGRYLRGYL